MAYHKQWFNFTLIKQEIQTKNWNKLYIKSIIS